MATINLGAIKFNWKGAYNNSTAYAVDDVVSSGGNSYVCIQASQGNAVGNATAYWNIMSLAGTNGSNGSNGTDVGTVITTQGDILYRDGSGLQRLPKGTAGQVLQMNSAANAPEYADATGGVVASGGFSAGQNIFHHQWSDQFSTSTSYGASSNITGSSWSLGTALTSNKTCLFSYSVARMEESWNHTFIRFNTSVDNGVNWTVLHSDETTHNEEYQTNNSGHYHMVRSSGLFRYDFTTGQTPAFRLQGGRFGSANNLKVNYDMGNNGTTFSYYNAWFI